MRAFFEERRKGFWNRTWRQERCRNRTKAFERKKGFKHAGKMLGKYFGSIEGNKALVEMLMRGTMTEFCEESYLQHAAASEDKLDVVNLLLKIDEDCFQAGLYHSHHVVAKFLLDEKVNINLR